MDTLCRDCVFASWGSDGIDNLDLQTGCRLNRLEKFQKRQATLTEETDEGKVYYRINRLCNTCRNADSLKDVPARKWQEKVAEQIRVRINMVVYVGPLSNFDVATITLDSILHQTMPANEITVALHGSHSPVDFINYFKENNVTIPWNVKEITEPEADYYRAIDLAVKDAKSIYYVLSEAGFHFNTNYIEFIEQQLNVELHRFVALIPDDGSNNGLFVQRGLHELISGNYEKTVVEKLREIADQESTHHMIKKYSELCEQQPL